MSSENEIVTSSNGLQTNNIVGGLKTVFPKSDGFFPFSLNETLVFYLSDLHIEAYISEEKSIEEQINTLVDRIIKSSNLLYAKLKYQKEIKPYSDRNDKEKIEEIEAIVFKDLTDRERRLAKRYKDFYVLLGGDIANHIRYVSIFFHRLKEWIPEYNIFSVLGNHEISEYPTVEGAIADYSVLCAKEGIVLLQNRGFADLFQYDDLDMAWAKERGINGNVRGMKVICSDLCFFGGIGFNKYDQIHNADTIITSGDIQNNVEKEKEECEKFVRAYHDALEFADKYKKTLIVLTHYPVRDWMKESECDSKCYYFYGHNHNNEAFQSNGAYVWADNQVGYNATDISFKNAVLLDIYNPFYSYEDGIHDVRVDDYMHFYRFLGEGMIGTNGKCKRIESKLDKGYKLKMIKKNGYYGFFLTNGKEVSICKGANPSKISSGKQGMEYYFDYFDKMINRYIELLTPYREYQEKIAIEVRKLGGAGSKHGLIVDFDFYHHIMINPTENRLYFYYSPVYGTGMLLNGVSGLLNHTGYNELEIKNKLVSISSDSVLSEYITDDTYVEGAGLQKIDISNSPYAISKAMRNLERVFDSGLLRDWNDDLINDMLLDNPFELPG